MSSWENINFGPGRSTGVQRKLRNFRLSGIAGLGIIYCSNVILIA